MVIECIDCWDCDCVLVVDWACVYSDWEGPMVSTIVERLSESWENFWHIGSTSADEVLTLGCIVVCVVVIGSILFGSKETGHGL